MSMITLALESFQVSQGPLRKRGRGPAILWEQLLSELKSEEMTGATVRITQSAIDGAGLTCKVESHSFDNDSEEGKKVVDKVRAQVYNRLSKVEPRTKWYVASGVPQEDSNLYGLFVCYRGEMTDAEVATRDFQRNERKAKRANNKVKKAAEAAAIANKVAEVFDGAEAGA